MVSAARKALARKMLRRAYELGQGLPRAERVALMCRLLYTLPPTVMAAEKQQWAQELFALARQLPQSGAGNGPASELDDRASEADWAGLRYTFREEAMATAAARLALYDPEQALALLDSLPSGDAESTTARNMAARLVFAIYLQRHGVSGAPELLAHALRWGRHGGFPYGASASVLATLSGKANRGGDDYAAEDFFQQALAEFSRGREGWHGVREFAALLERAVALQAISEESAEAAGRQVVAQLERLDSAAAPPVAAAVPSRSEGGDGLAQAGTRSRAASAAGDQETAARAADASTDKATAAASPRSVIRLSAAERREATQALEDVRLTAPQAYAEAERQIPQLIGMSAESTEPPPMPPPMPPPTVDPELQAAFDSLAGELRGRRHVRALRQSVDAAVRLVNARYASGGAVQGTDGRSLTPDAQSWALVSLAAYALPMTIGEELQTVEQPYWRAFFTAIAAQQVGEPARVADPTSHFVPDQEEAEPAAPDADQPSQTEQSAQP